MVNYTNKLEEILNGIDKTEFEDDDGWWETSTGAEFGAEKKKALKTLLIEYGEEQARLGRIDELALCLTHVPVPALSYDQIENRIAELKGK